MTDPATGLAGRDPEDALAGIAETIPLLGELKDRYLAQAIGPRQKAILEPLIDRRLDRAGGDLGRIAEPPTMADIRGLVGDVLPRPEGDPNIVRVGGGQPAEANGNTEFTPPQEPTKAPRGIAPPTEPYPGSPEFQAAMAKLTTVPTQGKGVILPNGERVRSEDSETGFLMSPVEDLREVAAAGWEAGRKAVGKALTDPLKAKAYGRELVGKDLGQGGRFDYQRLWSPDDDAPGYVQLRQFRDVSNFNVGLYMQRVGLFPLPEVLKIAGEYAKAHSSNYMPGEPYGLDPRVKRWIERGYEAGESGAFNLPFLLKKNKAPPRMAD